MDYKPPLDGPTATSEQELGPDEVGGVSTDSIYAALADHSRRLLVRYFQDTVENTASRRQLAEYVSERRSSPQDAEAIAVQLHHVHLPKLMETGIVEYEVQTGVVHYTPHPAVETHLDRVAPDQ